MIGTTFWELAAEHVFSFVFGLIVGFYFSNRWRLVRRNGDEAPR